MPGYCIISRLHEASRSITRRRRGVAQLVAHVVWDHVAGSSSLFTPTII